MIAIALAPLIQLIITFSVDGKTVISIIQPKKLKFNLSYRTQLISFTLMSFVSTFLINYIDINLRGVIADRVSESDAGYWTAITFISKNYMVFASGLFTLYVLPKFAKINNDYEFKKEVIYIYKTILPIFGAGMIFVYLIRHLIISLIYEGFDGMEPLFKWQLFGDFIRLCFLVLTHQFLAKKMVKSYLFIEFFSLFIFYILSIFLVNKFQTEGIVIAHFLRSIAVLVVVVFIFRKALFFSKKQDELPED